MVTAMVVTPLLLVMFLLGHATELHKMPFEMLINAVLAVFMVSAGGVIIHTAIKPAHSYQDLLGSVNKPGPHQDLLKSVNKLGSHLLESVNKPGPHQDLLESVNKLGSFYYDSIKGKAAGSFAIINSIIYGVDTFFAKQSIGIVE
ncbi:uncharacterized protein LOC127009895 [Eriocheir sinensis]|uniref:uncharacterized protein LOC127009895 n=1 Tax=Eriocheir sinensis TaxID=95602 RepID=UPI0021C61705|nr:uncharacterized protein LOC127009895 [Eriocheir sinensis]